MPPTTVIGTKVFDQFLEENDLRVFAIESDDAGEIERRFLAARFPEEATRDVEVFLERSPWPLAVRSSSLLEDSAQQPFTGVYETYLLPNDGLSLEERLERTLEAIRRVYASAVSPQAKAYLRATPYRLEEEKMAVILQGLVGSRHGDPLLTRRSPESRARTTSTRRRRRRPATGSPPSPWGSGGRSPRVVTACASRPGIRAMPGSWAARATRSPRASAASGR